MTEPGPATPGTPSTPGAPSTPVVSWEPPASSAGPAPGIEFAPHGPRLAAYIIDGLIISVVILVLLAIDVVVFAQGMEIDPSTGLVDPDSVSVGSAIALVIVTIVVALIAFLYFPFFWARGGQTPGMRPFGLVVVRDRDGSRFGWGTALLRLIGLWVAGAVFYLGFIWIFIDKRHRGWQDLIAGTVVIKRA